MNALTAAAPADLLLSRLEGVQRNGRGYRAQCPACGGKSRKLSITEADNGAILVHCFGSCEAGAVVQAVGLTLADLFPMRLATMSDRERRELRRRVKEIGWASALESLALEAAIVEIAARQLSRGEPLATDDHQRVLVACDRIGSARQVLNGR